MKAIYPNEHIPKLGQIKITKTRFDAHPGNPEDIPWRILRMRNKAYRFCKKDWKYPFLSFWNKWIHNKIPWSWVSFRYRYHRGTDCTQCNEDGSPASTVYYLKPCGGKTGTLWFTWEELRENKKAWEYFKDIL